MEQSNNEKIKQSYKYLIPALINHTNSLDLSNEDKNEVINALFNTLINTLLPEYSLMFLDEVLEVLGGVELQETIERQEAFDIIQQAMKG